MRIRGALWSNREACAPAFISRREGRPKLTWFLPDPFNSWVVKGLNASSRTFPFAPSIFDKSQRNCRVGAFRSRCIRHCKLRKKTSLPKRRGKSHCYPSSLPSRHALRYVKITTYQSESSGKTPLAQHVLTGSHSCLSGIQVQDWEG